MKAMARSDKRRTTALVDVDDNKVGTGYLAQTSIKTGSNGRLVLTSETAQNSETGTRVPILLESHPIDPHQKQKVHEHYH